MTCQEFHARLDEWALNALPAAERAEMKAHLAEPGLHDGCAAATREAMDAAALIPLLRAPARPGRDLWKDIEARLDAAEPAARGDGPHAPPPRAAATPPRRTGRRRTARVAFGATAGLVAAAALVFLILWLLGDRGAAPPSRPKDGDKAAVLAPRHAGDPVVPLAEALETSRRAPGARTVPLVRVGDFAGSGEVVFASGGRAFVVVETPRASALHVWLSGADGAVAHAAALEPIGTGAWACALSPALLVPGTAELLVSEEGLAARAAAPGRVLLRVAIPR